MASSTIDWNGWNGTLQGYWHLVEKEKEMEKVTAADVKTLAENLVNSIVADTMMEFEGVRKAILKLRAGRWRTALDESTDAVEAILRRHINVTE